MHIQQKFRRQQISEVLVIVAMALLLIYIADGVYQYFSHPPGVGQGKQGFLPINAAQRGMIFGASSIILFFLSFGIAIKEKSTITTILLIAGVRTSVLGAVAMAKGYSKFLLGCSHNGLHHNGIGYIQKVSEKIILYLLFKRI
jgi:hypothetical protein